MSRDKLDDVIDSVAAGLRRPPRTPRERMWARIDAARADVRGARGRRGRATEDPWRRYGRTRLWWPTAAAALLVLGIGLGRLPPPEGTPHPSGALVRPDDPLTDPALAHLTVDVLDRAEILLTDFRAGADLAEADAAAAHSTLAQWASGLLADTRILLDTRLGEDPRLHPLLADLEYALAQIAGLDEPVPETDRAWITAGLERRATLERLRSIVQPGADRLNL